MYLSRSETSVVYWVSIFSFARKYLFICACVFRRFQQLILHSYSDLDADDSGGNGHRFLTSAAGIQLALARGL